MFAINYILYINNMYIRNLCNMMKNKQCVQVENWLGWLVLNKEIHHASDLIVVILSEYTFPNISNLLNDC